MVGASLVAQLVKNLPAMQETQVQSLGHEDPLAEKMSCDGPDKTLGEQTFAQMFTEHTALCQSPSSPK